MNASCTCDIRVWFDTGFWYNEGIRHILDFGGEEEGMIDVGCVKWSKVHLEDGIDIGAFSEYLHSLHGTKRHLYLSEKWGIS